MALLEIEDKGGEKKTKNTVLGSPPDTPACLPRLVMSVSAAGHGGGREEETYQKQSVFFPQFFSQLDVTFQRKLWRLDPAT